MTNLDFAIEREDWSAYALADGLRVKLRILLTAARVRDVPGPNGEPIYEIDTQWLLVAEPAPKRATVA